MPKIEKGVIQPKMYGDPGIAWIRYDVRTVAARQVPLLSNWCVYYKLPTTRDAPGYRYTSISLGDD
eukprot:scaffold7804_cov58-Attheya_sp.AAC.1